MSVDQQTVQAIEDLIEKANNNPLQVQIQPVNRMTMLTTIHMESDGEQPQSVSNTFSKSIVSNDELYTKRLTTPSFPDLIEPIKFGHFNADEVAMICIKNLAGQNLKVAPSLKEQLELNRHVVCISPTKDFDWFIPIGPGQLLPIVLNDFTDCCIRSPAANTPYRIYVYPK